MAKRQHEEFNPWPSFVDIFSSVILVMLLFLLITIVNLGYYAQFKFKVSYTGSITTDDIILDDVISENVVDQDIKQKKTEDTTPQKEITSEVTEVQQQQKVAVQSEGDSIIEPEDENITDGVATFKSPGGEIIHNKSSEQKTLQKDSYYVVTFSNDEIFLDDPVIKSLEEFLKKAKANNKDHYVLITAVDPKNQVSATISKQISLGRTLSARNLIRKFSYDRKDVRINLIKKVKIEEDVNPDNGYIIIQVIKK